MTYQEFKEAVVNAASRMEIKDYELYYTEGEGINAETFQEEIKSYSAQSDLGACFRCIIDGKEGYASTENLTEEEAGFLVVRAMENARSIESEEQAYIHEKGDAYAVCEQSGQEKIQGAELVDAALKLQKEIYECDPRVTDGTQSYMSSGRQKYAICNSNGLELEEEISYTLCYAMPLVSEGGEMYDGFKVKQGRLKDFDLKDIAARAVEKAVSTIGAGSVPSGKYTVVMGNEAMATLLQTYSSVFSGEAVQKGMSLLKDKEGEKIAADIITIIDDPMYKDSMAKRTFDGEGVATYRKNVVDQGVLTTLLHNLKTAAAAGVKSTGNGQKASYNSAVGVSPFTFYIQPVEGTTEDMLALAGDGIYITGLEGLHAGANPITGDFSLSAVGFRIEDGRKAAPVKNITVSGNFFTLLKEIEKTGADLEFVGGVTRRCGSPSVLVRNVAIAGK